VPKSRHHDCLLFVIAYFLGFSSSNPDSDQESPSRWILSCLPWRRSGQDIVQLYYSCNLLTLSLLAVSVSLFSFPSHRCSLCETGSWFEVTVSRANVEFWSVLWWSFYQPCRWRRLY
jgi:hypothetical protein